MGKIVLYIASSLDGYITDAKGTVNWLDEYQQPGEDYGYAQFLSTLGAVVMGSKTYEQILTFDHWYEGVQGYVFSSRALPGIPGKDILFMAGDVAPLVQDLKQAPKDTWLVGGAHLITQFINKGLVDELILTIVPKLLGGGQPLFQDITNLHTVTLTGCSSFANGLVQLTYRFS